jgi:hypothetical protein
MPRTIERFFKMATDWTADPKVADLSRFGAVEAIEARYLFQQMIGYSRHHLTDGMGPGTVLLSLMDPLPDIKRVDQLAGYLADPGDFGPLIELRTAPGSGRIISWKVLAYAKWNDTRAEVDERVEHGRSAAQARWNGGTNGRR